MGKSVMGRDTELMPQPEAQNGGNDENDEPEV